MPLPMRFPTVTRVPITKQSASVAAQQHQSTPMFHVPESSALRLPASAPAYQKQQPQPMPRLFRIAVPAAPQGANLLVGSGLHLPSGSSAIIQQQNAPAAPQSLITPSGVSAPAPTPSNTGTSVVSSGDSSTAPASVPVASPAASSDSSGSSTPASSTDTATQAATGFFSNLTTTQKVAGGLGLAALVLWWMKK